MNLNNANIKPGKPSCAEVCQVAETQISKPQTTVMRPSTSHSTSRRRRPTSSPSSPSHGRRPRRRRRPPPALANEGGTAFLAALDKSQHKSSSSRPSTAANGFRGKLRSSGVLTFSGSDRIPQGDLDALIRVLPVQTSLLEFHFAGDRNRVSSLSASHVQQYNTLLDAPSLVPSKDGKWWTPDPSSSSASSSRQPRSHSRSRSRRQPPHSPTSSPTGPEFQRALIHSLRPHIALSQTLTSLSFEGTRFPKGGLTKLATGIAKNKGSLTSLSLAGTGLTDKALEAVLAPALAKSHSIARLDLSANAIGEAGAKRLGVLLEAQSSLRHDEKWKSSLRGRAPEVHQRRVPGILSLILAYNAVTGVGAAAFAAALRDDIWFECLDLSYNRVTQIGLDSLNLVAPSTCITDIELDGNCPFLTDDGLDSLSQALHDNREKRYQMAQKSLALSQAEPNELDAYLEDRPDPIIEKLFYGSDALRATTSALPPGPSHETHMAALDAMRAQAQFASSAPLAGPIKGTTSAALAATQAMVDSLNSALDEQDARFRTEVQLASQTQAAVTALGSTASPQISPQRRDRGRDPGHIPGRDPGWLTAQNPDLGQSLGMSLEELDTSCRKLYGTTASESYHPHPHANPHPQPHGHAHSNTDVLDLLESTFRGFHQFLDDLQHRKNPSSLPLESPRS